jgi:hypothetical protein
VQQVYPVRMTTPCKPTLIEHGGRRGGGGPARRSLTRRFFFCLAACALLLGETPLAAAYASIAGVSCLGGPRLLSAAPLGFPAFLPAPSFLASTHTSPNVARHTPHFVHFGSLAPSRLCREGNLAVEGPALTA